MAGFEGEPRPVKRRAFVGTPFGGATARFTSCDLIYGIGLEGLSKINLVPVGRIFQGHQRLALIDVAARLDAAVSGLWMVVVLAFEEARKERHAALLS
jgi:hypothetical protein